MTTDTPPVKPVKISAKEARLAAAAVIKAKKLHNIAERRAKAVKMSKVDYIAAIVAGKYPGITAEDIAAEPTPE
jgi:hypothetical protein